VAFSLIYIYADFARSYSNNPGFVGVPFRIFVQEINFQTSIIVTPNNLLDNLWQGGNGANEEKRERKVPPRFCNKFPVYCVSAVTLKFVFFKKKRKHLFTLND
jgi:hypothetical protein